GALTMNPNNAAVEHTVPFTVAQVWAILPAVFDSLGIPVNSLDPNKHLAGNAGFKLRQRLGKTPLSRYFDCGQTQVGPNADSYDVFLTVLTQVTPNGTAGARLSSTIDASAKPLAFSQGYSQCSSNAVLEKRLEELVTKLAGAPGAAKKP